MKPNRNWFDTMEKGPRRFGAFGRPRLLLPTLASCISLLSSPAFGQEESPSDSGFKLRGFATLGVARANTDDAEFIRDFSQPHGVRREWTARSDSIVGAQANYRANDLTELVLQGISRYRYDGSYSPELSRAFVKYDANPRLSFRAGRIASEIVILADSRMVGYAYLPVRPPTDYFAQLIINYADGADVEARWPIGGGVVRAGVMAGVARERINNYSLDGSRAVQGSLGYQDAYWNVRYIRERLRLGRNMGTYMERILAALRAAGAVAAAQDMTLSETFEDLHSLGLSYDDGEWQLQVAANRIAHETVALENSWGGYVLAARRLDSFTPFASYSRTHSDPKSIETGLTDPAFARLNAIASRIPDHSHKDSRTTTLGIRWDFTSNMDLKAQVDFVRASPSSGGTLLRIKPEWDGRMTVLSVALDMVF